MGSGRWLNDLKIEIYCDATSKIRTKIAQHCNTQYPWMIEQQSDHALHKKNRGSRTPLGIVPHDIPAQENRLESEGSIRSTCRRNCKTLHLLPAHWFRVFQEDTNIMEICYIPYGIHALRQNTMQYYMKSYSLPRIHF